MSRVPRASRPDKSACFVSKATWSKASVDQCPPLIWTGSDSLLHSAILKILIRSRSVWSEPQHPSYDGEFRDGTCPLNPDHRSASSSDIYLALPSQHTHFPITTLTTIRSSDPTHCQPAVPVGSWLPSSHVSRIARPPLPSRRRAPHLFPAAAFPPPPRPVARAAMPRRRGLGPHEPDPLRLHALFHGPVGRTCGGLRPRAGSRRAVVLAV